MGQQLRNYLRLSFALVLVNLGNINILLPLWIYCSSLSFVSNKIRSCSAAIVQVWKFAIAFQLINALVI